jgi:3-oxoacyl-[acyl-carrier-protein] synthase-1
MNKAIQMANIDPKTITYVNAHATSTPVGDANEALAIAKVFGDYKPYVSSTKSMTGHECWMAGASEIVYSMLMMQHSFIAPNINLEHPDEAAQNLNLVSKTMDKNFDVFLSNSFGFGGTNSALIIKKIVTEDD